MKYRLTENKKEVNGKVLYQIEALTSFSDVVKGDLGGWIEREGNLNQWGNAWVYENAWVSGNARVKDNTRVCDDARVLGNAWVSGNALVETSKDLVCVGPVGSNRFITFTKSNRMVSAGCFLGTIDEFKEAVDKKYYGESDYYPVIEWFRHF
jgi:hypothetical protein